MFYAINRLRISDVIKINVLNYYSLFRRWTSMLLFSNAEIYNPTIDRPDRITDVMT